MRNKYIKMLSVALLTLTINTAVVPSATVFAEQTIIATRDVEEKLPIPGSEKLYTPSLEEIDNYVQKNKSFYPNLSEERMKELLTRAFYPSPLRGSVWDGQGVTLDEFAFLVNAFVDGLLLGYGSIGRYAAKHGVAAAKQLMSRAALSAAQKIGIGTSFMTGLLGGAWNVINIYSNIGYSLAKFIDSIDSHPNNGRINAWK